MPRIQLDPAHPLMAELTGRTITSVSAVGDQCQSGEIGEIKSLVLSFDNGREIELRGTDDYAEDPSLVIEQRDAGSISREFHEITVAGA